MLTLCGIQRGACRECVHLWMCVVEEVYPQGQEGGEVRAGVMTGGAMEGKLMGFGLGGWKGIVHGRGCGNMRLTPVND